MDLIYWPSWSWPIYVAWDLARETYRSLPGPWWCKLLLCILCLAIPGPQDELALIALTVIARRIRAHRVNKQGVNQGEPS